MFIYGPDKTYVACGRQRTCSGSPTHACKVWVRDVWKAEPKNKEEDDRGK